MEHQTILIDEAEEEGGAAMRNSVRMRKMKLVPNGASASGTKGGEDDRDTRDGDTSGRSATTLGSSLGEEVEAIQATDSWRLRRDTRFDYSFRGWHREAQPREDACLTSEASFEYSLRLIERCLEERRGSLRRVEGRSSSTCIFRLPHGLAGINPKAQQPEVVSIGPFHRGEDHLLEFEEHKWAFLDKLLSRTNDLGVNLSTYVKEMRNLEERAKDCYSNMAAMSSHDFTEMMLLDGCFVVELLRHIGRTEDAIDDDDPIFARPWLIPILMRDLLKLENQLPFFILELLFDCSKTLDEKTNSFSELALRVFDLAYPRPSEVIDSCGELKGKHLLDLFYQSLLPLNRAPNHEDTEKQQRHCPSSIQCVKHLRASGIRFKPRKSENFLHINFRNRALEIPPITINDFTSLILINCVALEQFEEDSCNCFTGYAAFMSCLIDQPTDVALLCSDGIITRFSRDDQYITNLFNQLGKEIPFNIRDCYLRKQFREVEAYYSSNWAVMMRTYFKSPWSFISVFSASVLIVLTLIQTIMAVVSYQRQFG